MNLQRLEQQKIAVQKIKEANYNAAILATVGFGKGWVIVQCLLNLIKEQKIKSILYICDNQRLRDIDFPAELEKFGTPYLKKIIQCECYQTCHKWRDKSFDVCIGDEFDFALTKEYSKVFFYNTFKYKILVSGTVSADKKKILETIVPIVYTFSTTDAEQKGVINKTKYYIYNYTMDEDESNNYLKWTKAVARQIAAEAKPNTINYLLGQRKEVLYNMGSSVKAVRKVMSWLWNNNKKTRLIIFCERTSQADKVCKYSYHGGNEGLDNLTKFQSEEISGLSVVGKIKRGINLKNANTGIYESLTGKSTTEFEQRNGRLKRLPLSELATVIFMLPWYKTKDKEDNTIFKPTIVQEWIFKSTFNLKDIQFINLKV